jgi:chorismate synthase
MSNTFGKIFRLTTFGESHGICIGGIIDGCPAGLFIDHDFVKSEMQRRKPGQSKITTQRNEEDEVKFLSGIFNGLSTGAPIGFTIENKDQKSNDYDANARIFRPSHADFTYESKYGVRDYRGGGRSSARETACRVVAGSIAKLFLKKYNITVCAFVKQVGKIKVEKNYKELDLSESESNIIRCPDSIVAIEMITLIEEARKNGDSLGGIIECVVSNIPVGLGEPVFNKLQANLGSAMLGINAVKGFEYGSGFEGAAMLGSQHNDEFVVENGKVKTKTNFSGGIQGGISNGEDIYFRVAFKPTATILKEQHSVNKENEEVLLKNKGRHDPCVLPRAVPIVEAMAAIVLADQILLNRSTKL